MVGTLFQIGRGILGAVRGLNLIEHRLEGGISLQEKLAAHVALGLPCSLLRLFGLGILDRLPCRDKLRVIFDALHCSPELLALSLGQPGKMLATMTVTTGFAALAGPLFGGGLGRLSLEGGGRNANQGDGEEE